MVQAVGVRITVIGAGGTGCALLPLLATLPGVSIALIDGDTIEATNLPRQPLYGQADVGRLKVEVARERVAHITSQRITIHPVFIDLGNASSLLMGSTLVCDCTDDLPARLLIDRVCGELGIPLISGAVHGHQVQVVTLHVPSNDDEEPSTLRDYFPGRTAEEQEGCAMQQVPVHVTTLAGAVMAKHVSLLLKRNTSLAGMLELIDVQDGRWMRIRAPRAPFDQELIASTWTKE